MVNVQEYVQLKNYTTMRVGGPARFFVSAESVTEIKEAALFAQSRQLPLLVLGGGSNVVIDDEGFEGVVIHVASKGVETRKQDSYVEVTAAAGEVWDDFVGGLVAHGYGGLENLSGIPGSVGAAPVQNIGAYGVEVAEFISSVEIYDTHAGTVRTLSVEECKFKYRDSIFKTQEGEWYIITNVTFRLPLQWTPKLSYKDLHQYFSDTTVAPIDVRDAVKKIRHNKLPSIDEYGTCGSFFKNPVISYEQFQKVKEIYADITAFPVDTMYVKISAAWLLDYVGGWKGRREGNVGTYKNHALALVNFGDASAAEVLACAHAMQKDVYQKTGIQLEYEPMVIKNKK